MATMNGWTDDYGEGVDTLYKDWGRERKDAYCELCGLRFFRDDLDENGWCEDCREDDEDQEI